MCRLLWWILWRLLLRLNILILHWCLCWWLWRYRRRNLWLCLWWSRLIWCRTLSWLISRWLRRWVLCWLFWRLWCGNNTGLLILWRINIHILWLVLKFLISWLWLWLLRNCRGLLLGLRCLCSLLLIWLYILIRLLVLWLLCWLNWLCLLLCWLLLNRILLITLFLLCLLLWSHDTFISLICRLLCLRLNAIWNLLCLIWVCYTSWLIYSCWLWWWIRLCRLIFLGWKCILIIILIIHISSIIFYALCLWIQCFLCFSSLSLFLLKTKILISLNFLNLWV